MSVTIEEVMATVVDYRIAVFQGDDAMTESALRTVRNTVKTLVAQARDEEAEAIQSAVQRVTTGLMTCDANGSPATEYIRREQVIADIRARVAGRKA